ncbi:hypothetical protein [Mesorhizobium sp. WSM3862]|nr:hypothetical protein [Mesorhizobium sp. WSM3862]
MTDRRNFARLTAAVSERRLKVWRSEQADALLLGPLNKEPPILETARLH